MEELHVKTEVEWPAVELGDEIIDVDAPKLLSRPWDSESEEESSGDDTSSSDEGPDNDASNAVQSEQFMVPMTVKWFISAKTLGIHERGDAGSFRCCRSMGPTYFAVPALNGLRCGKCFAREL